jgi:cytochrome c553
MRVLLGRLAVAVSLAGLVCGCRHEMYDQPRSDPLEKSDFFPDGAASRPLVAGTVARGHLDEDEAFYNGMIGTNLVTEFPMPVTRQVLERGKERYEIYCSVCHARTGDGDGMIPQRGYPAPPTFHKDSMRQAPVGHFYDVITRGHGVMYSYASRVEPADRWAIVAYIRALQFSHDARLDDVPPEERAKLESQK